MANRRCFQTFTRYLQSFKAVSPISKTLTPSPTHALNQIFTPRPSHIFDHNFSVHPHSALLSRHFSSGRDSSDDDEDEDGESEEEEEFINANETVVLSAEDIKNEAAEIGYTVIGPLQQSDRVFKPYEPVFAVVQIGSHQFKVSNGDCIYTERLKCCDCNDKLVLNKVLMLGSETQTIIGRPILPDAAVHAVVEEHALDAKVIIFKKKRRKNYRRTKGHRQELTKLRITDIIGIEKPEKVTTLNKEKKKVIQKPEKNILNTEKKEKITLKTEKKEKLPAL